MKTSFKATYLLLMLLLVTALNGCVPQAAPADGDALPPAIQTEVPSDAEEPAAAGDPGEVALEFFTAYLASQRHTGPQFGSPEFPAAEMISDDYLHQMEEIRAGFEGYGFDPVTQTQMDPPDPVEVKEIRIDDSTATVVLQFGKGVMETPFERTVTLELRDTRWVLVPDRVEEGGLGPEETVTAFYDWYLNMTRTGGPGNTLSNRAYHDTPYLATSLVRDIDRMSDEGGLLADPFLCAQDVPEKVMVIGSFYNAMRPVVVLGSSFAGHTLVVDLVRSNFNQWQIAQITCGASYQGAAKSFFAWALGYMNAGEGMRNPWIDEAYRDSPYLSSAMIAELDARMASGEPLEADPVLLSQSVPQAMGVTACPNEQPCALVHLQYGDATVRSLRADFQTEMGRPQMVNITHDTELEAPQPVDNPLEGERWAQFLDEQYGYALRYPLSWMPEGLHVNWLASPQDYPVARSISLRAPGLPADLPAVRIDLYIGDEAAIAGAYDLTQPQKEFDANGVKGTLYRTEPGILFAVMRHPSEPDRWLIAQDLISQFPGREDSLPVVEGIFDAMLSTITFTK